jgi:ABC-type spermidine/putrescine transport system permease subunit II
MWEDLRYALDPTIAAVSTLTILVTVVPMIWVDLARRRGRP